MYNLLINSPNLLQSCYPRIIRVADHESEVSFQKSNMADPIWRTFLQVYQIYGKVFTLVFPGSLITNSMSVLQNSKWQI